MATTKGMTTTTTTDLHHTSANPETCHVCGRRAHGVATGPRGDRWLCAECIPLLEYVKDIRRWDAVRGLRIGGG